MSTFSSDRIYVFSYLFPWNAFFTTNFFLVIMTTVDDWPLIFFKSLEKIGSIIVIQIKKNTYPESIFFF